MGNQRILSETEAATLLGKPSLSAFRSARCRGYLDGLPFIRVGRSISYLESDVLAWMESRVVRDTHLSKADAQMKRQKKLNG